MEILLLLPGFILAIMIVVMYEIKPQKPQNKVHFYVTCEKNIISGRLTHALWLGMPKLDSQGRWASSTWGSILAVDATLLLFNLHLSDFENMKDGDIEEVYINLED